MENMEEKNYYEELIKKYDSWKNLVKNLIIERLEEYIGTNCYICVLADTLFEGENIDGSFTYSTYWSKELIKKYWDEFDEMWGDYLIDVGQENNFNIFSKPEKFIVLMLLEQAKNLLSNYKNDFINDNWDNKVELNSENIKKIIESLEA